MATTGLTLKSTGSCFKEATGFPSISHNNGRSIDTRYLPSIKQEQQYITAMKKFGCYKQLQGRNIHKYHTIHKYQHTIKVANHNSHLHSMFDEKHITIIKE